MSDNSVVYLTWNKTHYTIEHRDDENDIPYTHHTAKTLPEAIKKAKMLQDLVHPEYNIFIGELK